MRTLARPLAAEFVGTFGLVFVSAGAVVIDGARGGALGLLGVALAPAAVLAMLATAFMNVSGAHFNPAVTFAMWMTKHINARNAAWYVGTQLLAGVLAALCVRMLLPAQAAEALSYGVPRLSEDMLVTRVFANPLIPAILLEALLTFLLVSSVYGTAVASEAPKIGGLGIGLAVLVGILLGGPLTGAAMNPARAFGPALVGNDWHGHVAFWAGPLLGAALAAVVWGKILLPEK